MNTWQSNPIELGSGVTVDVKSDAEGVTIGLQSDGTLLIDAHVTDMASLAAFADDLTRGMTHCLAAREA